MIEGILSSPYPSASSLALRHPRRGRCPRAVLSESLKRSTAWIAAALRTRRTARQATELDDRLLADIGVSRAQIWQASRRQR